MRKVNGVLLATVAAVAIGVTASGWAYANSGVLSACVKKNGEVRLIVPGFTKEKDCDNGQVVSWSIQGEKGEKGDAGASTYVVVSRDGFLAPNAEVLSTNEAYCDPGDVAIGGGYDALPDYYSGGVQTFLLNAPILDSGLHAVGWKVAGYNTDGATYPLRVLVTCLRS